MHTTIGHWSRSQLNHRKGLDNASNGCIAQVDIHKYFDSLPVLRIACWLCRQGIDVCLVAAIVRHQLLPRVKVFQHSAHDLILMRSRGGLTGSFLALLLARVPIESTLIELRPSLAPCGFDVDGFKLIACTYIDNIYVAGHQPSSATLNVELIIRHLSDEWGLQPKDGSKIVLLARGCSDLEVCGEGWRVETYAAVLGWLIQDDGGMSRQWRGLLRKSWGAFFANLRRKGWRSLNFTRRMLLLNRCVEGILLRGLSAWGACPKYGGG